MRRRRLIALGIALLCVAAASSFALSVGGVHLPGSAARTAAAYFHAWAARDLRSMRALVDHPPDDFSRRHLDLLRAVGADSLDLEPRTSRATGPETAEVPFSGTLELRRFGPWRFDGLLRLAVRDGRWKVLWTPETLHPLLKDGGAIEVQALEGPATTLVTAEGGPIPRDGYNETYLAALRAEFAGTSAGWALVANGRRIKEIPPRRQRLRLTLSPQVQNAAARALDGVNDATVIALRASTGEVLAVADRLVGADAFTAYFPPGSAFTVITAAALLESGLEPDTPVGCPARYQLPWQPPVANAGGFEVGLTTVEGAFAWGCATTFVQQVHERGVGARLPAVAAEWGFTGRPLATGHGGRCGRMTMPADPAQLTLAVLGQGSVEATPLCMAEVAAAAQSGTWRAPRLLAAEAASRVDGPAPPAVPLDSTVTAQLRRMLGTVVSGGTASAGGLPDTVYGKTGTAETPDGEDHAWFIGYAKNLAFCVFVRHGGPGAAAAVSVAARFLGGL